MTWIWYVLLLQAVLAFFVSGGLFYKESGLKNTSISMLLFLFGIHILIYVAGASGFTQLFPQFYLWFYFEVAFLLGPILWIHLQATLCDKRRLHYLDLLHLLPILVFWIDFGEVLLLPGAERISYNHQHFTDHTMIWNYGLAIQMTGYFIAMLILQFRLRKMVNALQQSYSIAIISIFGLATLLIAYFTQFANDWRDFKVYYLVNNLLIFLMAYVLYAHPNLLAQIKKKYFSSSLEASEKTRIAQQIEAIVVGKQYYLKNNFSMTTLAELLNVPSYHISQTFTEELKENFNEYVNKHRAKHAASLLLNPSYEHYKVEAIAQEAGFNNKVTFYKAFSKEMGQTPASYRKQYLR